MRSPFTGLSNLQKFLLTVILVFVIAVIDFKSFVDKSRKIELYDDLNMHMSNVRVSISQLEYLLDMFSVARTFEGTSVEMIRNDVEKLDESVNDIFAHSEYEKIFNSNTFLSEQMAQISDDWHRIKDEVKRLKSAMTQEEIVLMHNAVDVNTVLIIEKLDRLLGVISESRADLFKQTQQQAFKSIVGFILMVLVVSLVFQRKFLSPIKKASGIMEKLRSGDSSARFGQDGKSVIGRFSTELNRTLDSIFSAVKDKEKESKNLGSRLSERSVQMEGIGKLLLFSGRTLNQNEIYAAAVAGAVVDGGASWAATYMGERDSFRLKAWSGLDFSESIPSVGPGDFDLEKTSIMSLKAGGVSFAGLLSAAGLSTIISVPIAYDRKPAGVLFAAFKNGELGRESGERLFLEALSGAVSLAWGHVGLLQRELDGRRFHERIIQQMPYGVAVFGMSGKCVSCNEIFKKLMGAAPGADMNAYSVFEDEAFSSQGLAGSIRKSFEGYTTEFILSHSPSLSGGSGPAVPPRRLRVKSLPLYDSMGEISNIMLVYEDISDLPEGRTKPGEAL